MCYAAVVIAIVAMLVYRFVPLYGQTHVMVYIGVCSLVGSISVCVSWYCMYLLSLVLCFLQKCQPNYAGHERESSWYSIEADLLRNEPTDISTDMGIYSGCHLMCHYPNELLEQGILIFKAQLEPSLSSWINSIL